MNPVFNNAFTHTSDGEETFRFLSNAFYGESPVGDWTLSVVDVVEGEVGEVVAWELRFYVGQHPD